MKKTLLSILLVSGLILVAILIINRKSDSSIRFDDIEKVISEAANYNKSYPNMKVSSGVMIPEIKKLYIYKQRGEGRFSEEDFYEGAKKFIELVTSKKITDEELNYDSERKEVDLYLNEDSNPEKWMGGYNFWGTFDISTMAAAQCREKKIRVEKEYFIKRDAIPEVAYNVDGDDYSVKEAVDFANDYLQKIEIDKFVDKRYKLSPAEVLVTETSYRSKNNEASDANYYYTIFYDIYIDGIPLNNTGEAMRFDGLFSTAMFAIQIDKKDHVGCIRHIGYDGLGDAKEYTKGVVTLESAMKELSSYLAMEYEYKISEIGLVYAALYKQSDGNEYHPYWRVILAEAKGDDLIPIVTRAAYIDLITGDITVFDDWQGQIIGTHKYEG